MPSKVVRSSVRQRLMRIDGALRKETAKVAQETGRILQRDHQKVVAQWKHQPKFSYTYKARANLIVANVYAYGTHKKIWFYVNYGTKPHVIRPKKSKFLKFQTGYSPRTARGGFGGPGKAFGPWVSTKEVHHPGSEARDFTAMISKRAAPRFRKRIEQAFRKAIRRN
jgi:hypothetical protein